MTINIKSRWQAFATHLAISGLIFAAIYAVTRLLWFPGDLFNVSNTWEGIRIIMLVDLVLGPLLTLVVFDRARKSLKVIARDLSIIAAIQFAGLAGGIWVVHGEKPVLMNLVYDTVHVYTQGDFDTPEKLAALDKLHQREEFLIYMKLPEDRAKARRAIQVFSFMGGSGAAGLELKHWRSVPPKAEQRGDMLRFTDKVKPLASCDHLTVKISSKHYSGRACLNVDSAEVSQFHWE